MGIILSVICFTGATLVFEKEITQWLNPHIYKVGIPEKSAALLTPSELVACLKTQVADSLRLSALQYGGTANEPVMVTFQNVSRKSLSVNPYTGEVNGWTKSYPFFQTMRKLHRWLLNPPLQKGAYSTGKVIVGISTLLMVVILVSGLVIWWPRSRKALRNRLQVSCTKGWRRFWYDSHVTLGFYSTLSCWSWPLPVSPGRSDGTARLPTDFSVPLHLLPPPPILTLPRRRQRACVRKERETQRLTIRHGIKHSSMYRPSIPVMPPFVSKRTRYK